MEKVFLTAAIVLSLAIGINKRASANVTAGNEEVSTVLKGIKDVKEIEVRGNVQVYLTSGETDNVKVYDEYYSENAFVQEEDNVLRITSYGDKKLVVWVTVSDLAKLSAFDNAEIKSFGKFSTLDLSVNLNDNAAAKLDVDAINASVTLNDHASADLTGNIENGKLNYDRFSNLNANNLTSVSLTKILNERPLKPHFHHMEHLSFSPISGLI